MKPHIYIGMNTQHFYDVPNVRLETVFMIMFVIQFLFIEHFFQHFLFILFNHGYISCTEDMQVAFCCSKGFFFFQFR